MNKSPPKFRLSKENGSSLVFVPPKYVHYTHQNKKTKYRTFYRATLNGFHFFLLFHSPASNSIFFIDRM